MSSYYSLLVLRMTPPPDCVVATQEGGSSVMRAALWGSEPWLLTGNAVRIDLKKDLPRILVPTYAFIGQYDEYPRMILTDLSGGTTHIPWIHTEIVPDAGHLTHIDNFAYVYSVVLSLYMRSSSSNSPDECLLYVCTYSGLNKWLDDTDSQPYFVALGGSTTTANSKGRSSASSSKHTAAAAAAVAAAARSSSTSRSQERAHPTTQLNAVKGTQLGAAKWSSSDPDFVTSSYDEFTTSTSSESSNPDLTSSMTQTSSY
eukprot:1768-Heterococcus_DN1.PRE.1